MVAIIDGQLGIDAEYPGRPINDIAATRANWKNLVRVSAPNGTTTVSADRIQDTSKNYVALGVVVGTFLRIRQSSGTPDFTDSVGSITTTTNPNDTLIFNSGTITPGADPTYSVGGAFASFGMALTTFTNDDYNFRGVAQEDVDFAGSSFIGLTFWGGAHLRSAVGLSPIRSNQPLLLLPQAIAGLILSADAGLPAIEYLGAGDRLLVIASHFLNGTSHLAVGARGASMTGCSSKGALLDVTNSIEMPFISSIVNCTAMNVPPTLNGIHLDLGGSVQDCVLRAATALAGAIFLLRNEAGPLTSAFNTFVVPNGSNVIHNAGVSITTNNWEVWAATHADDRLIVATPTQALWGTPYPDNTTPKPGATWGPATGYMLDPDNGVGHLRQDAPQRNTSSIGKFRGAFPIGIQIGPITAATCDLVNAVITAGVLSGDPNVPGPMQWSCTYPKATLAQGDYDGDGFQEVKIAGDGVTRGHDFSVEASTIDLWIPGLVEYSNSRFDDPAQNDSAAGATNNSMRVQGWTTAAFAGNPSTPTFDMSLERFVDLTASAIPAVRYVRIYIAGTSD